MPPLAILGITAAILLPAGCITRRANPACTQMVTDIDPATTQPTFWLNKPAVAHVNGNDFEKMWRAAEHVARSYLFTLDREDYRLGLLTTKPMVSKQLFEIWRDDTGTLYDTLPNTMATIRRSIHFQFTRNTDGTFTVTPKVLVERQSILERRITTVAMYRNIFAGPQAKSQEAVKLDEDADVPLRYWTSVGRDTALETQLAKSLQRAVAQ